MSASLQLMAVVALVPAMVGPLPAAEGSVNEIVLSLCNGGTITIPGQSAPAAPGTQPCCAKGCHNGERKRQKADTTKEGEA